MDFSRLLLICSSCFVQAFSLETLNVAADVEVIDFSTVMVTNISTLKVQQKPYLKVVLSLLMHLSIFKLCFHQFSKCYILVAPHIFNLINLFQLVTSLFEQYCHTFQYIDVITSLLFTFSQLNWEEKCIFKLLQTIK